MNRRMIFYILGQIIKILALFLLLPALVSVIYRENAVYSFLISAVIAALIGLLLTLKKPAEKRIYAKDGFVVTALAWIAVSLIGALPFYISREIPSFIDCFFETVSGFTTTGGTAVNNIEGFSRGLIFWRSFTHWIGGMGVLVFVMAIIPLTGRSMYLMRAESPGPIVGKLVPKLKNTAKILYAIYIFLTAVEVLLLIMGGMSVFDSVIHAFGTAGTGGFSNKAASIAAYNSTYIHIVITVFMALFGINFNIYFFLVTRNFRSVFKNEELRWYLGIIAVAIILIAVNIMPHYSNVGTAVKDAAFQTVSTITTTGYVTADYAEWPEFSQTILVLLMFCGASAGSTGGGIKVSRLLLYAKMSLRELRRMLHPKSVSVVSLDGKPVGESNLADIGTYFAFYLIIAAITLLLLSLDRFDFKTNFTAMASCLNNIGPFLGRGGPFGSYSEFSAASKLLLSLNMLFGRLELFPLLMTLNPAIWKKH
ncbi:MAG: TrkH family potassium uptake protein [Clostridiales bacterium]|jgi:trk system potassium uptake protein TrkH|nr:TrkH family potassium uptake protein [Clostridiales bacterium]